MDWKRPPISQRKGSSRYSTTEIALYGMRTASYVFLLEFYLSIWWSEGPQLEFRFSFQTPSLAFFESCHSCNLIMKAATERVVQMGHALHAIVNLRKDSVPQSLCAVVVGRRTGGFTPSPHEGGWRAPLALHAGLSFGYELGRSEEASMVDPDAAC